jgi:HEAT repeat protein
LAAIGQLGELGPAAMPALDTLLEALRTEEQTGRAGLPEWIMVAEQLRRISPTNRAAIAILLQRLENAQGLDPLNIGTELVRFDPSESHGLEVLAETLRSDPEANYRDFAAYVLRRAGPGARAAIPVLKAALTDKDKGVRKAAASALRKIEPADAK